VIKGAGEGYLFLHEAEAFVAAATCDYEGACKIDAGFYIGEEATGAMGRNLSVREERTHSL
jgi:hypothetical protein